MARIFSTLAVAVVLRRIMPDITAPVELSLDAAVPLVARIDAGEHPDAVILPDAAVARLAARGLLDAATIRPLCDSRIGLAVRAGAPHPDIATLAAFRALLLAAPSLAMSRVGASGLFMREWLARQGIAEQVNAKATIVPKGYTAERAACGEVAFAIQQISELLMADGIEVVGPLPDGANVVTSFSAACLAAAGGPARAVFATILDAMTPEILAAGGLEAR